MTNQRIALGALDVGDLLHAEYPNGAKLIGLTLDVTASRIRARDITRQQVLEFDRQTGVSIRADGGSPCTIYSTEPLPPELHEAMIGLDRKYGSGRVPTEEESRLTPAEKKALIFIDP
ncbi:MAG: hypothetical protein A3D94_22895 [Alphaproteobacteria bacterium RIFCSPHIGHO2_12_FULL_66_14]|jgi:hypothetical protein|nr:MAG: hypothetical protein A3D94_22895 [Alphaproteobacteria bacterium RIFCSPHIGHO2_12_FULL_66_14]